jgi:hypothetical protein
VTITVRSPRRSHLSGRSSAERVLRFGRDRRQLPGRDRRGRDDNVWSRTDQEWRESLSSEQYAVLREAATELPFYGEYVDTALR